jgi:hypothetical protein
MLSSCNHQCTALLAALHPNPTCQPLPLWWNTFWMCDFSNRVALSCSVPREHPTVPVHNNRYSDDCHDDYFRSRRRENQKTRSIRIRPRNQHKVLPRAPMALSNTRLPAPANASVPANQRHSVHNDLILIMEKVSAPPSLHPPAAISCNLSIPSKRQETSRLSYQDQPQRIRIPRFCKHSRIRGEKWLFGDYLASRRLDLI